MSGAIFEYNNSTLYCYFHTLTEPPLLTLTNL